MKRLYQINLRHFLVENNYNSFEDVPNSFWKNLKSLGFSWIWLLGVWQIAPLSIQNSKKHFANFHEDKVIGSCFAIEDYIIDPILGKESEFLELKKKLNSFGLSVMLDFIPNHFGLSESLLTNHVEMFINTEKSPNSFEFNGLNFALGRDPNFEPWSDTLQLDYSKTETQNFMLQKLLYVSSLCDGVRCDMAMLILPDIFGKNWSKKHVNNFWLNAINEVKKLNPEFVFLAEVYWSLESRLLEQGFDFVYHKNWLDFVVQERWNNLSQINDNSNLIFLENHDEERIASHIDSSKLLLINIFLSIQNGFQLWQDAQTSGRKKRLPIQVLPDYTEEVNINLKKTLELWLNLTQEWKVKNTRLLLDSVIQVDFENDSKMIFNFGDNSCLIDFDEYDTHRSYVVQDYRLQKVLRFFGKDVNKLTLKMDAKSVILISSQPNYSA
jgi:Alpha amylase, catalytic domain